ncbi:growth arrest and DNA damage-inducible proteins-interacting protein 1 [Chanos chanos]|uniref:Large ribosomal subunit protein mL64 n=1 Tax=Chanos chanos TaxID=29144 RepID=A0A6J2X033_CHACN|nr:growth arrest and DNA damage-inducible proteins-interacting protein 1 [Chanos chanos]
MAASLLSRRTARVFGISSINSLLPSLSQCVILQQVAGYNPKPLRLNLKTPYIPDKNSEKTPEWQKTVKYDRTLYGKYGAASGVDPVKLWPTHEQLDEMIAEEKEWHPPLEKMLENIAVKEKERAEKRLAREKLIAANMAKMPKMVADWKREKHEAKKKQKEDKARRDRLLAEARERFGYALDPRSPKFLEMVSEIEKEEKKKRKLLKRRQKEQQQGLAGGAPPPPAATS